jgi:hypothetical protein
MTNRLWHNLCGRNLYEGLRVTRNLRAEIIGSQDVQWLPDIRIRYRTSRFHIYNDLQFIMEYGAAPLSSPLPSFRRNILPPSSSVKLFSDLWILCLLETFECHCLVTRRRMGKNGVLNNTVLKTSRLAGFSAFWTMKLTANTCKMFRKMCANFRMLFYQSFWVSTAVSTYVQSANVRSHPKILHYVGYSYVLSTVQIIGTIKGRRKAKRWRSRRRKY